MYDLLHSEYRSTGNLSYFSVLNNRQRDDTINILKMGLSSTGSLFPLDGHGISLGGHVLVG